MNQMISWWGVFGILALPTKRIVARLRKEVMESVV